MSYTPKPGSIAAKIIEHLLGQPSGTELTSSEISAAIGVETPRAGLSPYLSGAINQGIVRQVKRDGKLLFALGGDPFDADERRGGKPAQRTVAASSTAIKRAPGPTSVFDTGAGTPPPTPFKGWLERKAAKEQAAEAPVPPRVSAKKRVKLQAKKTRQTSRKPAAEVLVPAPRAAVVEKLPPLKPEICCALFNTGDLVVEVPGQPAVRLTARQCADLVSYLQRFHAAAAA